ncbi:MAG: TIR domain-containing protein, partial [Gammaproteobacteria bacterium]|nr:TIR domain-containing protein [Gammaproteobacteria bacterium]
MDYRAFVSYAHEDKVWAAWMHKALERYRVPKRLRADVGTTTLRPIFRDKDELGYSGDLSATLIDALARSQSLIVVCSPHGARSFWVDQEVRTFKRLQPGRPILCALVDGDGGDPSSVFPPALLHELTDDGELGDRLPEPLAVDFRAAADGKRDGLLKLVAGILNLRFDELKMRERQWRRQRQVSLTAAAATLAFAVGIGTYYFSRAPDCLDQPGLYSELWSPDHRNRVQVAFAETGLPYAERVWRTIDDLLDQYATAWSSVHVEACEATYERKEQSVQLLDRRMMCLTDRRRNFVALREEFANAKLATLEHAVASASTLRDLTRCSDMEALLAAFPPPDNSAVAEAVNILKTDLVRTRAALMSGKVEGSMEAATDHANRAADTAYPPIEADALLLLAQSHLAIGEWKTAKNILYQSAARAVVGKEGELAAAAWLELPSILARNQADFREAFNMLQLAESYVASLPETHPLQGRYLSERGQVLSYSGRYEEGIALLGQSVTFARQYDVMHLPGYLHALAWSLVGDFRTEEAIEVSDEALVLAEQI